MFKSLFGDLPPQRLPGAAAAGDGGERRAPHRSAIGTDISTDISTEVGPGPGTNPGTRGGIGAGKSATSPDRSTRRSAEPTIDRLSDEVLVDDSPAEAIRQHFAAHRHDLQRASAMLTLLDPSRLWAAQVLQALASAGGQPVQRLNLRERATLRTLAVIARTLVPRHNATPLRVYHADIHAGALSGGLDADAINCALAEGSQLTAVIVGAMQPQALVALLRNLLRACRQPGWRCPHLVFLLPPGASALRQRILAQHWPPHVQAHALAEPLACAASVWNQVLRAWEASQAAPGLLTPRVVPARPASTSPATAPATPPLATALPALQPLLHLADAAPCASPPGTHLLNRVLLPLARSEGLLACGIVDLDRGDLLASQHRNQPPTDLSALAEALCAARLSHQAVAPAEAAPDEILVTTGARQTLLRRLPGGLPNAPSLGFVAVLDRAQANLALLRFKLMDVERLLA